MSSSKISHSDFWVTTLISACCLFQFLSPGNTSAFDWPAYDMANFLERLQNPSFLKTDFFTNVYSQINARYVYAFFQMGLGKLFGVGWYGGIFFLKVLHVVFLPAITFLVLSKILELNSSTENAFFSKLFVASAILFISYEPASYLFAVGFWPPMQLTSIPGATSTLLGFAAILILFMNEKNKSVAILFWIAAVFIHPVRGLITFLFFLMIDDGRNFSIKDKLQFGLVGIVAPILICQVLFSGTSTLTDKSFVYYYVDTFHGFHFRSTSIETHTSNSWAVTFGCMIVAMSLPYFWASKKDDLWLKRKTILFVSSYSFSVLVQIFFTEVLPNKTIVSIGPNRFSHLGYFFLVLQYGRILSGIQFPRFDFVTVRKNLRVKYLGFVQICLGFASAFLVLYTSMDKPLEVRYQQQKNFFDWIQKNTPEDAVFATPYHLVNTYFSLVAKRSLYTFIGVAAREDMLQEQARRYMNLYGTPEIHAATGKAGFSVNRLNHYSSLTPEYFQMLSTKDKLDYVVIDSRHTFAFRGQPVAFQDQIFTVYKVSDLDVFAAARYTKTTLAKPEVNELLSGLQIQWQN